MSIELLELDLRNAQEIKRVLDIKLAGILEALRDTTISLFERWTVYHTLVTDGILNNSQIYGDGYIDVLAEGLTLYDDFYIDRYQTKLFTDMYEQILENGKDYNIEAWQEAILQSGFSGFTNDW